MTMLAKFQSLEIRIIRGNTMKYSYAFLTFCVVQSSKVRKHDQEAFMQGMHADTENERERAKAMEKRRCDRLGSDSAPSETWDKHMG